MQTIVEIEGVLFDVQAACWHAYSQAVAAIGLARKDEATVWRLLRTGAGDAQLVTGARPHQLERFRLAFDAALEADEALAKYVPHDDLADALRALRDLGPTSAVTCGANLSARHQLLRGNKLADTFPQLTQAPPPPSAAAGALHTLAARRADQSVVVVFGATVSAIRAADESGMIPIGITSGPAIGKRLAAAGARATYADVATFAEAMQARDEALRRAGLVF